MSSPVRTLSKNPTSWTMTCENRFLRSRHITFSALALKSLHRHDYQVCSTNSVSAFCNLFMYHECVSRLKPFTAVQMQQRPGVHDMSPQYEADVLTRRAVQRPHPRLPRSQ